MTFPANPTNGQQATEGGRLYQYNGTNAWELVANVAGHAATHAAAGSDPLTLSASQITGLGSLATASSVAYSSLTGTPSTFSPSAHASTHATGGTDAITPSSIGAAASSHTHAATDITSGTLDDARLSTNVTLASTLAGVAHSSSAFIDVVPRHTTNTNRAPTSGVNLWTWFTAPINATVSQISMSSANSAASGLTLARMGLYTWDGTTLTLVARTASDTTLFAATNSIYTRSFDSTGGFASTVSLVAGTRYAVGVCVVGTTVGTLVASSCPAALGALTPRVQAVRTGNSDLLTSNATFNGTMETAIWARLS